MSPLRSKSVPTQVSPEATARPVSTEGSQARLVSQAWNSEEGQVGFFRQRQRQKIGRQRQRQKQRRQTQRQRKDLCLKLGTARTDRWDFSAIDKGKKEEDKNNDKNKDKER